MFKKTYLCCCLLASSVKSVLVMSFLNPMIPSLSTLFVRVATSTSSMYKQLRKSMNN